MLEKGVSFDQSTSTEFLRLDAIQNQVLGSVDSADVEQTPIDQMVCSLYNQENNFCKYDEETPRNKYICNSVECLNCEKKIAYNDSRNNRKVVN